MPVVVQVVVFGALELDMKHNTLGVSPRLALLRPVPFATTRHGSPGTAWPRFAPPRSAPSRPARGMSAFWIRL